MQGDSKIEIVCAACSQSFRVYRYDYEVRYRKYCSAECQGRSARVDLPGRVELATLYHDRKLSTNQLAEHYGVSKGTIYNWMKSLGVSTRSIGEAISIAQTGRPASEARKSAIGRAHRGRKKSPDEVRAMSECRKGIPNPHWQGKRNPVFSNGRKKHTYKAGIRPHLGVYLRSSWEANVALWLNWRIEQGELLRWEYEADVFSFPGVLKGAACYIPDFKLFHCDGTIEYLEVKGRETSRDRTKWSRMKQHYPKVKLTVLGSDAYKSLQNNFGGLPHWER